MISAKSVFAATVALTIGGAVATAAPVIVIDDFSAAKSGLYPYTQSTVGAFATPGVDAPITGTISSGRVVVSELLTADEPGLDEVTVRVFPSGKGVFDYASSVGASGRAALVYGNFQNVFAPLNLAIPDGSMLKIDLVAYDQPAGGSLQITGQLENTPVGLDTTTVSVTSPGAQSVYIPLDSISPAIRANVTNIVVGFTASTAVDFRVDKISIVIPEPSAAITLGPVALMAMRRRRR
jgi:hypothetical protein